MFDIDDTSTTLKCQVVALPNLECLASAELSSGTPIARSCSMTRVQGLTLVNFSAQLKRYFGHRGCDEAAMRLLRGHLGGGRGCD